MHRNHRKIPIISPGLIFVQKAVLLGFIFGGAYFQRGLLLEGILHFKKGLSLTIKQLALTVHGLIFGRAYYWKDFCV